MKVDYGEIIFQSTEGVTEDQGMVLFQDFAFLGILFSLVIWTFGGPLWTVHIFLYGFLTKIVVSISIHGLPGGQFAYRPWNSKARLRFAVQARRNPGR